MTKKATKTKPGKLTVHVVLDRSGSMMSVKDDTIGAFNSYVSSLAKDAPKVTAELLAVMDAVALEIQAGL